MTDTNKGPEGFENLTPEEKKALEKQLADMRNKRETIVLEQKIKTEPEVAEALESTPEVEYVESEEILDNNEENEKKSKIEKYKGEIDFFDGSSILNYGLQDQSSIQNISQKLGAYPTGMAGDIGEKLTELIENMKECSGITHPETGINSLSIVKKIKRAVSKKITEKTSLEDNIKKMENGFQESINTLQSDNDVIQETISALKSVHEELSLRSEALLSAINEAEQKISERKGKCTDSEVQEIQMLEQNLSAARRRLNSLEVSKHLALQSMIQCGIIGNSNVETIMLFNDFINNYVPIWRIDLIKATSLANSKAISDLGHKFADDTEELIANTSKSTKELAVSVAEQRERSLVDVGVIEGCYKDLEETIMSIRKIADDGEKKRREGLAKLQSLEQKYTKQLGGGLGEEPKQLK